MRENNKSILTDVQLRVALFVSVVLASLTLYPAYLGMILAIITFVIMFFIMLFVFTIHNKIDMKKDLAVAETKDMKRIRHLVDDAKCGVNVDHALPLIREVLIGIILDKESIESYESREAKEIFSDLARLENAKFTEKEISSLVDFFTLPSKMDDGVFFMTNGVLEKPYVEKLRSLGYCGSDNFNDIYDFVKSFDSDIKLTEKSAIQTGLNDLFKRREQIKIEMINNKLKLDNLNKRKVELLSNLNDPSQKKQ